MSDNIPFLRIEKRVHTKFSFDNSPTKIQDDFLTFLVDFINEIKSLI